MWRMNLLKCSAIAWFARFRRDPFALLIVVLAGLGTAHILVRTATYGAGIGEDSVDFLFSAMNFLAGGGWRHLTGAPLTEWPPLFPLLLAAFGWVGIDLLEAGRWINAVAAGLTILVAGCWLRSNLRSQWLALAATATLAASYPLSDIAARFLTDSLFALLTLFALMQLAAFLNRRANAPLWWAAVFTALTAITRYPGVALIGTGVLILLPFARLRQTLVFGAVSSVPLLAVLVRNWAASGYLTQAAGYRPTSSGQSLSDGLAQTVEVFRAWIVPRHTPDELAYLLGLAVAAVVLAGVAVVLRSRRYAPEAAPVYVRLGPVLPFGVFTVIYLVFLIAVVPSTTEKQIDSRYLLPIYVPLLLAAVFLLDWFLSIEAAGWRIAVRYGLVSLVLLATLTHLCFSARRNLRRTAHAYVFGYPAHSFNAPRWQHSEILNYIRDHHIEGRVYSDRDRLAWFANRSAPPGKYRNLPRNMQWTEIEAGAHIVWFRKFNNRLGLYGYDTFDLQVLPGVELVAELAEGFVFRVTAAEPFDAKRHRARKQRYVQQLIQQASEQVVRAGWGVYRTGRKLIYFKEPCAPSDVQAKFVLHVVPVDPANLPAHRQQYGSDNLDFPFDWHGERVDDQCTVLIQLPDYAISRIYVGQWIPAEDRTVWEAELPASP